jgi:hypothetical protein
VRVGRVVDDELRDHANPARVRLLDELLHVLERPVRRVHAGVVRDVVPVVTERRRKERQEPQRGDPELGEVVQP